MVCVIWHISGTTAQRLDGIPESTFRRESAARKEVPSPEILVPTVNPQHFIPFRADIRLLCDRLTCGHPPRNVLKDGEGHENF